MNTSSTRYVNCPRCGTAVEWSPASRWRPFCSERCKLIDLGDWAAERFRVPVAEPDEVEPAGDDAADPVRRD